MGPYDQYQALARKKEAEYQEKMQKYEKRLARHRLHMAQHSLEHGYGSEKQVARKSSKLKNVSRPISREAELPQDPSSAIAATDTPGQPNQPVVESGAPAESDPL